MSGATNDWKCFFISPIKEPGTDVRRRSDDVMDLLLIPSLARCGFNEANIVRSDQLDSPNVWNDMMDHLDNDELCIADITDLNANVMFEFGYRRGSKKALIVIVESSFFDMKKKDEKRPGLPFDVHNYRIIQYDLTTPKSLRDTGNSLRNQIRNRINDGFFERDGRGSIVEIDSKLSSIEEKLDRVLERAALVTGSGGQNSEEARELIRKAGSPIAAFNYALQCRDVRLMEGLLPSLEASMPKERYIDSAVSQTAMLGSTKAAAILRSEWPYITENLSIRQQYEELGCYVSYCNRSECEPEEYSFVLDEANRLLEIADTDDLKAGLYTQINRMSFGAYMTQKRRGRLPDPMHLNAAIDACKEATELEPEEPAYYYNLATCYREKGDSEKAVEVIRQCLRLDTDDDDHLTLAYRVFKDAGLYDEAQDARRKLKAVNPIREAMLN